MRIGFLELFVLSFIVFIIVRMIMNTRSSERLPAEPDKNQPASPKQDPAGPEQDTPSGKIGRARRVTSDHQPASDNRVFNLRSLDTEVSADKFVLIDPDLERLSVIEEGELADVEVDTPSTLDLRLPIPEAEAPIENVKWELDVLPAHVRRNVVQLRQTVAKVMEAVRASENNIIVHSSSADVCLEFVQAFTTTSKTNHIVLTQHADMAFMYGGCRINDFFRFQEDVDLRQQDLVRTRIRETLKQIQVFVIAAVEDTNPETLDAIDWTLRRTLSSNLPFAGKRILLVGNVYGPHRAFSQSTQDRIRTLYPTSCFFSTPSFADGGFSLIDVSADTDHVVNTNSEILERVATGRYTDLDINTLNDRASYQHPSSVTIVGSRHKAHALNHNALEQLQGKREDFRATILAGEPDTDSLPCPLQMTLCVGARVLFLTNDPGGSWQRGSTGIVQEISKSIVSVAVDGGALVTVDPVEWTQYTWTYDTIRHSMVRQVYAQVRQLPLQLGYAIGSADVRYMTLYSARLDFHDRRPALPGELFQILATTSTLGNLVLDTPILPTDVVATTFDKAACTSVQEISM